MFPLTIPQAIVDEMLAHARELDPFECCGLLAGKDGRVVAHYPITNTIARDQRAIPVFQEANVKQLGELSEATRAEVAYFMDPKELLTAFKDIRQRNLELSVIYHSHTHSPAYPSQTDIGLAYYPEAAYVIISLENKAKPDLRAFWIIEQRVRPAEFQVV